MTLNLECYKFKEYNFPYGLLDESVDVTYILHLEGNGRLDSILNQINKYTTTKLIYIVFNKGYKKCKKADFIKNTVKDLMDANLQIFKHAQLKNYNNILILEDDFFFDDKIKDKTILKNVNTFLNKHKHKSFIYSLGCIPFISIPYDRYHYYSVFMAMHACIFSKLYREDILKKNQKKLFDWDEINPFTFIYEEPMCYQLVEDTENKTNWYDNNDKSFLGKLHTIRIKTILAYLNFLELDKSHHGFSKAYFISKILFIIFVIIFIYISVKIKQYYKKKPLKLGTTI